MAGLVGALAAAAVALVLLLPSSTLAASSLPWSNPVRVSTAIDKQVDWFPAVAADNTGNVHIVWNTTPFDDPITATDTNPPGQLSYVRWNGQSWTQQTAIALTWYGYALRNSLITDRQGNLALTYKGWPDPGTPLGRAGQDIYFVSAGGLQGDSYANWTRPVRLSQQNNAYYSALAEDSKGVLHAVFTEGDQVGKYALYYTRSANGGQTWSKAVPLEASAPVWWYRAQLKIDGQDRIHLVYELGGTDDRPVTGLRFGVTHATVYAQSDDGGQTWRRRVFEGVTTSQAAQSGETLAPGPQQPAIGIDGSGQRLLVYRDPQTEQIKFRQSRDGETWSPSQAIPGIAKGVVRPYDVYDMATDSAGHVHLVAIGYAPLSPDRMSVIHAEWDGTSWSRSEVVASAPPFPEYPRLAIGQGNRLHVVWFSGTTAVIDRRPNGVWYSTALTDAPARQGPALDPNAPLRAAVPAPTAVPTPGRVVMPPPQPLSEASRLDYQRQVSSTNAYATLREQPIFPIAIAAIPALLLVVGIVGAQLGLFDGWRQRKGHTR